MAGAKEVSAVVAVETIDFLVPVVGDLRTFWHVSAGIIVPVVGDLWTSWHVSAVII